MEVIGFLELWALEEPTLILAQMDLKSQAEATSAESVSAISKIDVVKQRMEAAYKTLQV